MTLMCTIVHEVGCRDDTVSKTVDTRRHCKVWLRACNNLPQPVLTRCRGGVAEDYCMLSILFASRESFISKKVSILNVWVCTNFSYVWWPKKVPAIHSLPTCCMCIYMCSLVLVRCQWQSSTSV